MLAGGNGGVYRYDGSTWSLENAFASLSPGPFGIAVERLTRVGNEIWAVIRTANGHVLARRGGSGGFTTVPTGCGANSLSATGNPDIGGTVTWTLTNYANVPVVLVGLTQLNQPLCASSSCRIGAAFDLAVFGASLSLLIPANLVFVGRQLFVQGVDLGTPGGCVGLPLTVTDTSVLTIG